MNWPFDRVVCVNLDRRPDRWRKFRQRFTGVKRFPATDGQQANTPPLWGAGGPAWGCADSHIRAIRQAIEDGVGSLLLFEDDAKPVAGFAEKLDRVMANVPPDWEQLYLGGQHQHGNPQSIAPGVGRPSNVGRTHAWALRGAGLRKTLDFLTDFDHWGRYPTDHIDHRLGRMHTSGRVVVYAALPWLVIQGANLSDINGQQHADRGWQVAGWREPAWVVAKRPGVCRVGFMVPSLDGVHRERLERLAKLIRGESCEVIGVAADGAGMAGSVSQLRSHVDAVVRITDDWETLQASCDVVIAWGVGSLSPLRSVYKGPVVCLGFANSNEAALLRLAPMADHWVADSDGGRERFPRRMRRRVVTISDSLNWRAFLGKLDGDDTAMAIPTATTRPTTISPTGVWVGPAETEHRHDPTLADAIAWQLRALEVGSAFDLGCGPGRYVELLNGVGIDTAGIDGNGEGFVAKCRDKFVVADLTAPLQLTPRAAAISLEVGEHIPPDLAEIYLDNINRAAIRYLILSWALPGQGGFGHVNERPNEWVIDKMRDRRWKYNAVDSERLRALSTLRWFRNTIMVFER